MKGNMKIISNNLIMNMNIIIRINKLINQGINYI